MHILIYDIVNIIDYYYYYYYCDHKIMYNDIII